MVMAGPAVRCNLNNIFRFRMLLIMYLAFSVYYNFLFDV